MPAPAEQVGMLLTREALPRPRTGRTIDLTRPRSPIDT
jgi:hypothetical protein